jgi:hemoglobin-like flavoprotein
VINYEDIFNLSYFRALGSPTKRREFFDKFYEKFIGSSPEVQEKFRETDMGVQKRMLDLSIHHMSTFSQDKTADDYLIRIAKLHGPQEKNIRRELYQLWLDALVDTLREQDPEFDEDVELAWRMQMAAGVTYMKKIRER